MKPLRHWKLAPLARETRSLGGACLRFTLALLAFASAAGCSAPHSVQKSGDGGVADASHLPPAQCGNGLLEHGEACDGTDLGGLGCANVGFFEGALACYPGCTLDTSGCIHRCGNGRLDPGEQCDGADIGGATCQTIGLGPGTLGCQASCTFALGQCSGCGNGVLESGEACDGQDLGGRTCDGLLACTQACLLDATACALPEAGDGADGDLVVSGEHTLATPEAAAYVVEAIHNDQLTLAEPPTHLQPGDEVLVVNLRGVPEACITVGAHELARVASVADREVLLEQAVSRVYGAGGQNSDLTGQRIMVQRVPRFSSLHVLPGAALRPLPWDGSTGGILVFRVSGLLRVDAGGGVLADGAGYSGGVGWAGRGKSHGRPGESFCGRQEEPSYAPNHGGGGGGRYLDTEDDCGQGGGGGGYGTTGAWESFGQECVEHGNTSPALNGGDVYGGPTLSRLLPGSGGGAGATDDHSDTSGTGGNGGGIIWISAAEVHLDGVISARGSAGTVPTDTDDSGNGGAGSGGAIRLEAGSISGTGALDARGGPRTAAVTSWNNAGARGGDGRIRVGLRAAGGFLYGSIGAEDWLRLHLYPEAGHMDLLL